MVLAVKRSFLLLNGSSKLICVSTSILPNHCFKSQSNYIFSQHFFGKSSYLNSPLAFSKLRRFLCIRKGNSDATENSEFQAQLSNELKLTQLRLDEAKKKAINKSGYVLLPIESIIGSKIKFSLKRVCFAFKINLKF